MIEGTSNDDTEYGPDSWVEFTVIQGGTYYVAVGADGAGTGTYKLWVKTTPDGNEEGESGGRTT